MRNRRIEGVVDRQRESRRRRGDILILKAGEVVAFDSKSHLLEDPGHLSEYDRPLVLGHALAAVEGRALVPVQEHHRIEPIRIERDEHTTRAQNAVHFGRAA